MPDVVHAFLQHGELLGELVGRGRLARSAPQGAGLTRQVVGDDGRGHTDPGQNDSRTNSRLPPARRSLSLRSQHFAPGSFRIALGCFGIALGHVLGKPGDVRAVFGLYRVHAFLQRYETLGELMVRGRLAHASNICPITAPGKAGGGPADLALAATRTPAEGAAA